MFLLQLIVTFVSLTISARTATASSRSQGPCDIYGAANTPCVAAHSTTRALYANYNGPLYQLKRESDGKALDIGVVQSSGSDPGGYANAAAQDAFCANTICVINAIYDQSGNGNHLLQAPPGTFKGPAKGAFDTQPIADMAPVMISGHKVYGVFMIPGMGLRNNNAKRIAVNDEPEGIYYVIDGTHFDSGCCFDYGNASTNGRAVGTGTMETVYFGTSTVWGSGNGPGPWIMSDMEAGLFSGHDPKRNVADPTIDSWRFVTAVMDGGGGDRWNLRGGNAQRGGLTTFYDGPRPAPKSAGAYFPMRKQGGILLGTGGDNGNGSSGTFYEGVMTSGYPTEATTDTVQKNIVAARYTVGPVNVSRVKTFTPGSEQSVTETFTNTGDEPATKIELSLAGPNSRWTVVAGESGQKTKTFAGPIAPGASVSAAFKVTPPASTGAGLLTATGKWEDRAGRMKSDTAIARVRNGPPVRINEFRLSSAGNSTDQFIELYNGSAAPVDISGWSVVGTPSQWPSNKVATIPSRTKLAPHGFYLLGLADSGLAAPAPAGTAAIHLWNTKDLIPGQQIDVDGETRTIATVGSAATPMSTVFIPVSTEPRMIIPAGSTSLPVTSTAGFEVGQKIGIDLGGRYEEATVTAVGKPGTQTTLAAAVSAGATSIKLAADANIALGDTLTVGTGTRKEVVKVTTADEAGTTGGIHLAAPLKFDHAADIDASDVGTGVSFSPATRFPHMSGDAIEALGSGIMLDQPLSRNHSYGAPVLNRKTTVAGYQGMHAPNQWFGSALSSAAGSIALLDSSGSVVVDAVVYGSQQSNSSANGTIATPELAILEGDQGKGGCIVVTPGPGKSAGRYPDGADTDSNCADLRSQAAASLAVASAPGESNIKVTNVEDFHAGQRITIGAQANHETAVIASVGSAGATTIQSATKTGATVISVSSVTAFRPGQKIVIGNGADQETAEITGVRRRGSADIVLSVPLIFPHATGTRVAGTGITLTNALARPHEIGAEVFDKAPTPGQPNEYSPAR